MNLQAAIFILFLMMRSGTVLREPLFTFGIISDVQYSDHEPAGNRFYKASAGRLEEAVNKFTEQKTDFIINLGDLIDKDFSSYGRIMNILDSSGIPVYHITGNHDFAVEAELKGKIPVLMHKGYFSISRNGFRLIFLNGNEISTYSINDEQKIINARELLEEMKRRHEINAVDWNGGIGSDQLSWLEEQLKQAHSEGQKVIMLSHFPLFPEDIHNLLNYKEVLNIIGKYLNIVAVFSGHNHAGNSGKCGNTSFITFRGMVETEDMNSYAIVKVYSDMIVIEGYGREPGRVIEF